MRTIQDTETNFYENYRDRNAMFRDYHAPKCKHHVTTVDKNETERKKQSPEIANRSRERSDYPIEGLFRYRIGFGLTLFEE